MKLRHKRKLHNNVRLLRSLRRTLAQVFRASFRLNLDQAGTMRWFGMTTEEQLQADLLIMKLKQVSKKLVSKRIKK